MNLQTPPSDQSTLEIDLARHAAAQVTEVALDHARDYVDPEMLIALVSKVRPVCSGKDSAHLIDLLDAIAATAINLRWRCEVLFDGDDPPIPTSDWRRARVYTQQEGGKHDAGIATNKR